MKWNQSLSITSRYMFILQLRATIEEQLVECERFFFDHATGDNFATFSNVRSPLARTKNIFSNCIKYRARFLQHRGFPLYSETICLDPFAIFNSWIFPNPSSAGSRAVPQRPEVLSLYPQKSPPRPVHISLAHF